MIVLNRDRLKEYRSLKKEIPRIKKKLKKLYKKKEDLPEVMGKVKSSSKDFPYIETHVSVQMDEPKAATELKKQISILEKRLMDSESEKTAIESFVAGIPDSTNRQIFEMAFYEGKTYEQVGDAIGYTKGRISQKISEVLKD